MLRRTPASLRKRVNRSKLTVWRNRRDVRPQAVRDRSAGTICDATRLQCAAGNAKQQDHAGG
jgi:hypothetical protein